MNAWVIDMQKIRVSAKAVARIILANFEKVKPLSQQEAEQVYLALQNSGVDHALTRLNATTGRILLKEVVEQ